MRLDKNENILFDLDIEFAAKVTTVLKNCKKQMVEIELRGGIRNTFTQAVYWKRSKPDKVITEKIEELQQNGADFLAYCLFAVGEQQGVHITNAIPGLSWHQYGLAVDCVWILDSNACWDNKNLYNGINGYEVLAMEAKKQGIWSGHTWNDFQDSGHLQANSHPSPLVIYSLENIDQLMQEKYLHLLEK